MVPVWSRSHKSWEGLFSLFSDIISSFQPQNGCDVLISCPPHCSSIFVSVAQAIFTNSLASGLQELGVEGLDGATVASTGLTGLTNGLSGELKEAVLTVINNALVYSWRLPVVMTCVSLVGVLGVEHRKRT